MREILPKKIHFIGIGGIGVSGLAVIARQHNIAVQGSDYGITDSMKAYLIHLGCEVFTQHSATNLTNDIDCVVISSAIKYDNPEIVVAKQKNIPIVTRGEFLNTIIKQYDKTVAITGMHGKTSTTGILAHIAQQTLNASFYVGGILENYQSNALASDNHNIFIYESDESDGSMLKCDSKYTIITNIDNEHMDYYKTEENVINTFTAYMQKLQNDSYLFCNNDCKITSSILKKIGNQNTLTFGLSDNNDITIKDVSFANGLLNFKMQYKSLEERFQMASLYGTHNAVNAAIGIFVTYLLGGKMSDIKTALLDFKGIHRRTFLLGTIGKYKIFDDYAHNPSKIESLLKYFWQLNESENFDVVLEPHRYSRLKHSFDNFVNILSSIPNDLYLTPIYTASEIKQSNDPDSKTLFNAINQKKDNVFLMNSYDDLNHIFDNINKNVLLVGAGKLHNFGIELLRKY